MSDLGKLIAERNNKKIYALDGVVTKVFDKEFYSGSDVLKEAMNQAYAKELGFLVPEIYSVEVIDGNFAIKMEEIKGQTLQEMATDKENTKKVIKKLVEIQLSVLSKLSSNLKLVKLKDKLNNYISNSGLDASTRYDLHVRLEKMPNHYKVCHGDLTLHNIVINQDGQAYILDWAHVTRGNASADAAVTYLSLVLDGKEDVAEMYLKEFCKKSDIAIQYVQQWISVVSSSKLATTKDEAKREMLLRNINVVEY